MLISDFWRNLAKEFRALPNVERDFRAEQRLCLDGEVPYRAASWSISCSNHSLELQWESLAKRGGDALSENDIVDPVYVWLETLRTKNINSTGLRYSSEKHSDDGSLGSIPFGEVITDLREASAILCGIMESTALSSERMARAVEAQVEATQERTKVSETPTPPSDEPGSATNDRRHVVEPLLKARGWSVLDWATRANVAHATAMDYLDLKTYPYQSTRLKLANALKLPLDQLPE